MAVEQNGVQQTGSNFPATLAITEGAGAVAAGARVDGSDLTIGTTNDAPLANPNNPGTLVAVSKGVLKTLMALAVGTPVTIAAGADATAGSPTDAPLAAAATNAAASVVSILKGLFNLFYAGTARVVPQAATWWLEFGTATQGGSLAACAAGTTYTGTSRPNTSAGAGGPNAYFTALVLSTVAGTMQVNNGPAQYSAAVPANTPTTLKVPAMGSAAFGIFTAGNAGTFAMTTMYSAA